MEENISKQKAALWLELILLFVLLPLAFATDLISLPKIPSLILIFVFTVFIHKYSSCGDKSFNWRCKSKPHSFAQIFLFPAIFAIILSLIVIYFQPDRFLFFPKQRPLIWIAVIILYPILSVIPQEFIYRVFFFERYKFIFKNPLAMIIASSILFSHLHIVFKNPVAVILTLFGGFLFSYNYHKNKSLFWVCVEHNFYGWIIFTAGLGYYFYGASFK